MYLIALPLLIILLLVSGLFSGAETVLFSLSRHDRARMKKSRNRLEVIAANLVDRPRPLLTALLIGNMTCNIIVFVLSSLLLSQLQEFLTHRQGAGGGAAYPNVARAFVFILLAVPPLLVTYVSDVFPKVLGSLNNTRIAPFIALPVSALVNLLFPVSKAIEVAILRPTHRLVGRGGSNKSAEFSTDELRELLELSQQQGVIDVSENELLQEVVRIADIKVRDVLTPRVDMLAFNIKDPPEKLIALFRQSHLAKVPVFEGQIDNILGLVYAKTLLLEPDLKKLDVRKILQPVRFVPEQQTLERLLVHFRQTKTQLAIVVDEFGGITGIVALQDVVEQMVGDIYEPHDPQTQLVQRLSPDEFLVPGDLSITDWMDAFGGGGVQYESTHTTTVAGLFSALLKRLPRLGDTVRLAHLQMTVESMRGRRLDKVRLKLLPAPNKKSGKEGTP